MKVAFTKQTESYNLVCKLSDDQLKLFLDFEPLQPLQFKRDHLIRILCEFTQLDKIDVGVLDDIAAKINEGKKVEERRIAKGKAPSPGIDGKILLLVKKYTGRPELKADSTGYISYSDLHLFDNIKKEQIVARIYHPHKGVDGVSALGEVLPAELGKPVKVEFDKSLTQRKSDNSADEFDVLVAQSEGYLAEESKKLIVKPELVIEGDLDLHVGNIDFIGSVVIKGDANKGFSVRALKGIDVRGCLNGAMLIAPDGPIKIKGLARGAKESSVTCGKDVEVGLAQELEINAAGKISVGKQALDCRLRSASTLEGPNASLVGGETFAVCGVDLKQIGNPAGLRTSIILCSDVEASPDYIKLSGDIASHQKAFDLITLHLGPLAQNSSRVQLLKEPHKGKMLALLAKLKQVRESLEKLEKQRTEMMQHAHISTVTRVNVRTVMHEGVHIQAGQDSFSPPREIKGPASITYLAPEHKFETGELKPLECVTADAPKPEVKGDQHAKR